MHYNFLGLDKGTIYYFSIEALGETGHWKGGKGGGEVNRKNLLVKFVF